jgi:hypothetical protein
VGIDAKTGSYPGMAGLGGVRSWSGGRRRIPGREDQEAHCDHLMSRTCGGKLPARDLFRFAVRAAAFRAAGSG